MAEPNFMVIVVGGSIAGLTLAHCLDKADIGYLVIERNERISPQVGASIGIMPNGARVLDQLELFNTVESEIEPLDKSHICYPDDFSFTSSFPTLLNERYVWFLPGRDDNIARD